MQAALSIISYWLNNFAKITIILNKKKIYFSLKHILLMPSDKLVLSHKN